jgi:hypothetical protein
MIDHFIWYRRHTLKLSCEFNFYSVCWFLPLLYAMNFFLLLLLLLLLWVCICEWKSESIGWQFHAVFCRRGSWISKQKSSYEHVTWRLPLKYYLLPLENITSYHHLQRNWHPAIIFWRIDTWRTFCFFFTQTLVCITVQVSLKPSALGEACYII